jgi:lipopolysaccharide export system protein LptC
MAASSEPAVPTAPGRGSPFTATAFAPAPDPLRPATPTAWLAGIVEALTTYLPVLLMALLALGTWWLVKNTPLFESAPRAAAQRHEPDYTMTRFVVQRFAPDGTLKVQIEGDVMRHYPDDERLEVDNPHIRARDAAGNLIVATARLARSNADGSELQLNGGAHLQRNAGDGTAPVEIRGETLQYFVDTERVVSTQPVTLTHGRSELRANALIYDNLAGLADLSGRIRASFVPAPGARR